MSNVDLNLQPMVLMVLMMDMQLLPIPEGFKKKKNKMRKEKNKGLE